MFPWEIFEEQQQELVQPEGQQQPNNSQQQSTPDEFDSVMSEAEKRLEVAQYYKLLLQDSLFTTNTPAAQKVESEIRTFIKDRLSVLLGVKPETASVTSDFSLEEVDTLKRFAALTEGPEVLKAVLSRIAKQKEPSVKTVKPTTAPTELKKREIKPERKKREPKVTDSAPIATVTSQEPQAPSQNSVSHMDDGSVKNLPKSILGDKTLVVKNGKAFVQAKSPAGEPLWEQVDGKTRPLYKDVTPKARPVGVNQPVPIPTSRQAFEVAMANKAAQEIDASQKRDPEMVQITGQLTS